MKISIFGLTLSSSWGNGHATPYRAVLRSLSERGHEVTFFEKDVHYYAAHRDLPNPDFCDLVLYDCWNNVKANALDRAAESDVVVTASYCPEGSRINDAVLELAGPLKVYYDLDTPVTLGKFRSGMEVDYVRVDQLREFDLVLSWTGGASLAELQDSWGARIALPLFGCVDPDVYQRVPAHREFGCALSYMGTYASDRQEKLDRLFLEPSRRRSDLSFLLAGSLYPWGWQWGENVKKLEHVPPQLHPALYSSSRCTLNITRADMAETGFCPSGRFFEAAACGTPIISDWFTGLDYFFSPDEEIFISYSADDTLRALESEDEVLLSMAKRARERTLDENTGTQRADQFLRYCEQAASESSGTGSWRNHKLNENAREIA